MVKSPRSKPQRWRTDSRPHRRRRRRLCGGAVLLIGVVGPDRWLHGGGGAQLAVQFLHPRRQPGGRGGGVDKGDGGRRTGQSHVKTQGISTTNPHLDPNPRHSPQFPLASELCWVALFPDVLSGFVGGGPFFRDLVIASIAPKQRAPQSSSPAEGGGARPLFGP